jgi:hypothetical protein
MRPSSYSSPDPASTVLSKSNGSLRTLVPNPQDAHLLVRVLNGQEVGPDEIRSVAEPNWGTLAEMLSRLKCDRAQKEALLLDLLERTGIDPDPVVVALLQVDPSRPPAAWAPPIEPELPLPGTFPLDGFPAVVRRFIRTAARSIGCPVDFVAAAALTVLGGAIGNSGRLRLKPGWDVSGCLYTVPVGEPSDGKSPAILHATEPLRYFQHDKLDEYREEVERWRVDREAAKQAKTAPPPRPRPERLVVDNFTGEVLIRRLDESPRGLFCARDEVSGLISGFNQYRSGRGEDCQRLMSIWSHVPVIVDRIALGEEIHCLYVHRPFLSILGGLNADNLPLFLGPARLNVGYFDRHLFAYPEPIPKPDWNDVGLPIAIVQEWRALIKRLLDRPMGKDEKGRECPRIYQMDDRGKAAWKESYNKHAAKMREPRFPRELKGPWGKLEEYAGRFTLISCLAEYVATSPEGPYQNDETDNETCSFHWDIAVEHAWSLVDDYFKPQVERVLAKIDKLEPAPAGANESKAIQDIIRWIQTNRRMSFRAKDLEFLRRFRGEPRRRDEALAEMVRRGYIRQVPEIAGQGSGKKSSPSFEVNGRLRTWESGPLGSTAGTGQAKVASSVAGIVASDRPVVGGKADDATPSEGAGSNQEPVPTQGDQLPNCQNCQTPEGTSPQQIPPWLEEEHLPLPDDPSPADTPTVTPDESPVRLPISTLPGDLLSSSPTPGNFGNLATDGGNPVANPLEGEGFNPPPPARLPGNYLGNQPGNRSGPDPPPGPEDLHPGVPDQDIKEAGEEGGES